MEFKLKDEYSFHDPKVSKWKSQDSNPRPLDSKDW
jgi:hypothetical protein